MDINNPPNIMDIKEIINKWFNPKSIEAYGFDSDKDNKAKHDGNKNMHITILPGATITKPA